MVKRSSVLWRAMVRCLVMHLSQQTQSVVREPCVLHLFQGALKFFSDEGGCHVANHTYSSTDEGRCRGRP